MHLSVAGDSISVHLPVSKGHTIHAIAWTSKLHYVESISLFFNYYNLPITIPLILMIQSNCIDAYFPNPPSKNETPSNPFILVR